MLSTMSHWNKFQIKTCKVFDGHGDLYCLGKLHYSGLLGRLSNLGTTRIIPFSLHCAELVLL